MAWPTGMRVVAAVAVLAGGAEARADTTMYQWVDAGGDFHVTDRLDDVPEPYRSMYVAREKERRQREEARRGAGAKPPAPSRPATAPSGARPAGSDALTPPSGAGAEKGGMARPQGGAGALAREQAREAAWRKRMLEWRQELGAAMAALAAVDEKIAEVGHNPILRQTPAVQEELARLEESRRAAAERVEAARHMLAVELPARARKEQVSPKWLEP